MNRRDKKRAQENLMNAIAGEIAKADLKMHGHEMAIGYATVRLLEHGEPVTARSIFQVLNKLEKPLERVWEEHLIKAFPFLEQLIEDSLPPEEIEEV